MTRAATVATNGTIPEWTLADRMRKSREKIGLSQEQMAAALDISRQSVSNYEQGRTQPLRSILARWAIVTDVPSDWLGGTGVWAPRGSNPQPTGSGSIPGPRDGAIDLTDSTAGRPLDPDGPAVDQPQRFRHWLRKKAGRVVLPPRGPGRLGRERAEFDAIIAANYAA